MPIEERFPRTRKEREEVIKKSEEETAALVKGGVEALTNRYAVLNSPLDGKNGFMESFRVLFQNKGRGEDGKIINLGQYIENSLPKEKIGKAVGIEFGGEGEEVFVRGFRKGVFKKTLGVTAVNSSPSIRKINEEPRQLENGDEDTHQVLESGIFSSKTDSSIEEWLNGDKVDLILSRMLKGVEYVPAEPNKVAETFQKWYGMLSEGGMMFIQVPIVFNNLLKKWAKMIQEKYKGLIDLEYQLGERDRVTDWVTSFRITKLAGAPDTLPFLSAKEVRNTPKYINSSSKENTY